MKRNMKIDQNNMWPFKGLLTGLLIRKLCFFSFLFLSVNSAALDDGTWTYELDGDSVKVTGCFGACPSELLIPDTIAGKSVTSIGSRAFFANALTIVTIPDSVVVIEAKAFMSSQITSVNLPDSLTGIGFGAFSNNQLTSVVIPSGLCSIAD